MANFSQESLDKLSTCHVDLQRIFTEVIKFFDCKVTEGFRDREAQEKAFAQRKSKLHWPNGNHNQLPSMAADVYPFPIDMTDIKRFYYLAGLVRGISIRLLASGDITHSVRWGGAWNGNFNTPDELNDLPHYELQDV